MNSKQQLLIGNTIKFLTYIAICITCLGYVCYIIQNPQLTENYAIFNKHAVFNWTIFIHGLLNLQGYYITLAGILLLMLSPFLRILFITIAFAIEKDKRYTIIGTLILFILLISAYLGAGH